MLKPWRSLTVATVALALLVSAAFLFLPTSGPSAVGPSAVDATSAPAPVAVAEAPVLAGRGAPTAAPAPVRADGDPAARPDRPAETAASDSATQEPAAVDADEERPQYRDGLPLTIDHPRVLPVAQVQERRTREILRDPRVVGTAIGRNEQGEIALVVLTKAPIPDFPSQVDGVPVLVLESGELTATKGKPGGSTAVDPTARFARPVPIGVSTGHPAVTAGTIGCRVRDAGGQLFALSNNHVYANENLSTVGDAALQPGTFDGGASPADDIGVLHDFVTLDFSGGANTMDCALVLSASTQLGNATPSDGYGRPRSATLSPAIGLHVQKYGRTTSLTSGRVYAINASVNVGYSAGTAFFVGQVIVTPGTFSAGGDSGSLIVGKTGTDARKPVALLFAGSPSVTIGCPIGPILSHFDVTVDGD